MASEIRSSNRLPSSAIPAAVVVVLVIATGSALKSATGWTSVEMGVLRRVNLAHTPALDEFALTIDWLFGPPVAVMLVLLGGVTLLLVTRQPRTAIRFMAIVMVPWLGTEVVKLLVQRPRPDIPSLAHVLVLEPGGLSFPSGHTSFAACLLLGLLVVARGRRWRPVLAGAGTVVVLSVACSRVYLGVHYPTDVAASIVYATAGVTVANALWSMLPVPHWSERRPAADAVPGEVRSP
ncbi:phosphatase PAP2 family protein [Cryobacterium sp. TMT1-21]|uniref:Phosphatase PAP2 family protein n=1 Tax=Cryobacterium shii TaxID=1259235 RepID=A0AAQ2C6E5_9MICO|nr:MULTISPECIES: phosphatase PAP2 family protein [Cryobacterium]TFC47375.1 phosphatase PAP2 family protein [Cryobacterium shii]TFC89317.1 phosphatase PAP2 family protein [Cryobacterium sp. TmT2-59]TFD07392.1 phosphatase PAP2 family protein [Cryobacterium sp. TMT1-21]TFD12496.1 phosphatase PAP2 family protein [Cryobacterium sp. TMT4-10]TFD17448.1 phosphatase PAP2 family protein [Cryobacterium sp. TMT2-23]